MTVEKPSLLATTGKRVTSYVAAITTLAMISGGVLFVEDRYVHASDLEGVETRVQREISTVKQQARTESLEMRRWYTEQRLADIETKPAQTQYDRARIEQLKRELQRIDGQIQELERNGVR